MRDLITALAISAPFLVGASIAADDDGDVVLRFQDSRIVESSGLVVDGDLAVTVNDSGHDPVVYSVDLGTGRTVGTTTWQGEGIDVEALAPAGAGEVWVGDIGDNLDLRDSVVVTRVPYGTGDQQVEGESYRLAYPDGAADAEALLVHPETGRLYVVTKDVFGGSILEAPAQLNPNSVNRLRQLGEGTAVVTDGAFFPDGQHLILRNYAAATVFGFPSLEKVGTFALPRQQQGEGIAVSTEGEIYLSSEGAKAPLLEVTLPDEIADAMAGEPQPTQEPEETPPAENPPATDDASDADEFERDAWPWVAGGLLGLAAVVVLVRSLRPR